MLYLSKDLEYATNAIFSHFNVTSVVRAAIIGSVNFLAKVIFAVLDMILLPLLGCKLASFYH